MGREEIKAKDEIIERLEERINNLEKGVNIKELEHPKCLTCGVPVERHACDECTPKLSAGYRDMALMSKTIGWTWAVACSALDCGEDPRTMEIPAVLERAKEELAE